ncbi:nitroreductase family protein [Mesorhizobium sp. AR10]|uniref:nitroreductase family protein n=1 Tax=Mesorhizobium sp. AR10 TaxID=2865839 RepID=UPI00215E9172|nr:nitroreductase family protein [Mesorhizobium sp. AR10]UVK41242.1 nitroreductase family protein [Mesorhizobium sp. AR10]
MLENARKLRSFLSTQAKVVISYVYDVSNYLRYNGDSLLVPKKERLYYRIIVDAHSVEKGLSLKDRRPGFGQQKIKRLMKEVSSYDTSFGAFPLEMAVGALRAYVDFHPQGPELHFVEEVRQFVERFTKLDGVALTGGVQSAVPRVEGPALTLLEGLQSRHSVRHFDQQLIDRTTLLELVRLAQGAPSQCNRQATRVYVYQGRHQIDRILALQGGARGFSQSISNLVIVTSDTRAWRGSNQRNQIYVDGALFLMHFLLAAEALRLVACPLNLAVDSRVERQIRSVGRIRPGERLIACVALGPMAGAAISFAKSPRRPIDEVVSFIAEE